MATGRDGEGDGLGVVTAPSRPKFAPWIPEVLAEIEGLLSLREPPCFDAVWKAREVIVNRYHVDDRPIVSVCKSMKGGLGITISWDIEMARIESNGTSCTILYVPDQY